MTTLITLTTAGTDSGPFNLYSDLDGFTSAFAVGVSKASLLAGYSTSAVPDYTTTIRVKSVGLCLNFIDITLTTTSTTTISPVTCETFGSAVDFAVIGATTITNIGLSTITGDLGLYPGTSVVGFPPGVINGTQYIADVAANSAQTDASNVVTCIDTLPVTGSLGDDIGGTTITPGVYSVASFLNITGTVTLDGLSDPDAVFIFKIPSTFIPAVNAVVSLVNGAQAGNIYWIVGSSATLSLDSVTFGNIIAQTSITINADAILTGKAIALTGVVTMNNSYVTNVNCTINPCISVTTTTTTTIPAFFATKS